MGGDRAGRLLRHGVYHCARRQVNNQRHFRVPEVWQVVNQLPGTLYPVISGERSNTNTTKYGYDNKKGLLKVFVYIMGPTYYGPL